MGEYEIAAIMLLVGFLGGVLAGIVAIVSIASRREDQLYTLNGDAPDAMCRAGRRLTGMRAPGSRFSGIEPPFAGEELDEGPRWPVSGFRGL
ncbi:hypothetical protein [Trebonia sp.]|uniref:hypothetical protein n=1 Tax=Trebonia sp. TaxID=2767075 RepID=UPI002604B25E|nr:hypothetical protein [Trebonia sp.]